jgi:hypothetical protein
MVRPATQLLCCLLAGVLLAGCSGDTDVTTVLGNSIKSTIEKDDQRQVSSVDCTPHRSDVSYSDGIVHVNCTVTFADGTTWSTPASIEARSFQVTGWNFNFDDPGPVDITTAPLPQPNVSVAANSPGSLFFARNLRPVYRALKARLGTTQLVLQMAIYPSEVLAVVGANGQARLITAHPSGAMTLGPETSFDGDRSGIDETQLDAGVPQQLAREIAGRGGVPVSGLDRYVLASHGGDAYWEIYPKTGTDWFQAHVLGDSLVRVTPEGKQPL